MSKLKAGTRLQSSVCSTEVMIVKAPEEADLRCGGAPLVALGQEKSGAAIAEGADGGTQIGKRYVDAGETLEVLCTKPGQGTLALGDVALTIKGAKPLPSSD
jgi:hypothetical protein